MRRKTIKVEVRLYATLRKYHAKAGADEVVTLQMPESANLTTLLARLGVPKEEARITYVNNRQKGNDYLLRDGDRVAIFPPVGGG